MTKKKLALVMGVLALVTILGVVSVGAALAQTTTPPAQAAPGNQTAPAQPNAGRLGRGLGFGFGLRGGDITTFDTVAKALNLTPTQLFEQLHAGKTLSEIATAQGIDLSAVQTAVNGSRIQALKDKIAQAVTDGTITQDQANWLLQGIDKGWAFGGKGFGFGSEGFGFQGFGSEGHGRGMRGMRMPGMRGLPFGNNNGNGNNSGSQPTPSTSGLGTSS